MAKKTPTMADVIESVQHEAFAAATANEEPVRLEDTIPPSAAYVDKLITKLCEDAMQGRMRDEFQHYDAIAKLYTAIK